MRALGYIVSWIVTLIGGILLNGWALSVLWGWFIVSSLHAPALTIPEAIGITLIMRFLTLTIPKKEPKSTKTQAVLLAESFGYLIVGPFVSLGLGWIVHLFI